MLPEDLKHSGPARETGREEPPETPGPSQLLSREVIDDVLLIADTLGRRPVRSVLAAKVLFRWTGYEKPLASEVD